MNNNHISQYKNIHPADIADYLQNLPISEAIQVFRDIPLKKAAWVLVELEHDSKAAFLDQMSSDQIAALLSEVPHDDSADIIGSLPEDKAQSVLSRLVPADSNKVAKLLKYDENSAGGIMNDRFIAVEEDMNIQEAKQLIKVQKNRNERSLYVYVVDSGHKLCGVITLRTILFGMPDRKIKKLMIPEVKAVSVNDDQEKVARMFAQYHYKSLPVIKNDRRLVGIVDATDIIDIIDQEATEDMQLMFGLSGEENIFTPWTKAMKKRLPWLYVKLLAGSAAATVISIFEPTIGQWTALAVFFPIIAAQGGSAGMQTLMITLRGITLKQIGLHDVKKAFSKELLLGFADGLAVGVAIGVIGWLWKGDIILGIIACIAMMLNMIASALAGVMVPLGLKLIKVDPALASGIFLTTITDVLGFFVLLGLGALVIHFSII
jgi:magnesium transporter